MKKTLLALAFMVPWTGVLRAQGTFENLNFESAQIIYDDPPYREIATTNALPYWSAFSGTNQLANVLYGFGGAVPSVALFSNTNGGSLNGNYSVFLAFSTISSLPTNTIGSISQTGLVPANAESLLFELGTGGFFSGPVTVSLGGQDLSYIAISNALNYTLYGADISSFAGQTETLTFTAGVNGGLANAELDDIQFSAISVPEPSAISLLCLGSGVLFCVRKRRRFRL